MEQIEEDSSSWDEVKVTTIFTTATAAIFVTIFELCRRSPAVSVVFDRRRASKPQRTPPPLLRNSIFEWLFLSNDPTYVEYADLAHMRDVIYERMRQRHLVNFKLKSDMRVIAHGSSASLPVTGRGDRGGRGGRGGTGGNGAGADARIGIGNNNSNSSTAVDVDDVRNIHSQQSHHHRYDPKTYKLDKIQEDYDRDWLGSHDVHIDMNAPYSKQRPQSSHSLSSHSQSSQHTQPSNNHNKNNKNNNNISSNNSSKKLTRQPSLQIKDIENAVELQLEAELTKQTSLQIKDIENSVELQLEVETTETAAETVAVTTSSSSPSPPRRFAWQKPKSAQSRSSLITQATQANLSQAASNAYHAILRVKARTYLTPEVVVVNNRRLPIAIQKYALAGDLTSERLDFYAQSLLRQEEADELEFRERRKEMIHERNSEFPFCACFRNLGTTSSTTSSSSLCCWKNDKNGDLKESQLEDASATIFGLHPSGLGDNLNSEWLTLPLRTSRFNYIGFEQGGTAMDRVRININSNTTKRLNRFLGRMWNSSTLSGSQDSGLTQKPTSFSTETEGSSSDTINSRREFPFVEEENVGFINRYLKLTTSSVKRPLSVSDSETLRCTGLDTFVMLRFLRFCFDVTFYPFIVACILLIPIYYSNKFDGIDEVNGEVMYSETSGYFHFTMNRLETSNPKLWVSLVFSALFHIYLLRRWIVEWETFVPLRLDFLANGDVDDEKIGTNNTFKSRSLVAPKDDTNLHLEQYRNSCIVEYVPESHRRDQELFQFFNAIFPNEVKRAEVLINANQLSSMIKKRQKYIELYEVNYARDAHAKQQYNMWETNSSRFFLGAPKEPQEPVMVISGNRFCCGRQKDKAMPYLLREIDKLNHSIKKEYRRIMEQKQKVEDSDAHQDLIQQNIARSKNFLRGVSQGLACDTGFVEFKSLTSKQYALQCNLTGNILMKPSSAPDPNDIFWENATVERKTIIAKNMHCDALLFTGTLFWSAVVALFTAFSDLDAISPYLPDWIVPEQEFLYNLMQGYLPVVLLEALMLIVPFILRIVAKNYIRFKTHSEIDIFVYRWHFGYRVMNLIIIIVKNQLFQTFDELRTNPQRAIDTLASGIALSSQFFLNNIIFAIGTEAMFELTQIPKMVYYFIVHQFITVEATSQRALEKLEKPMSLEWGHIIPPFIFSLLVSTVYCTNVPIVTGVCAIFFYVTTKVYTHQALFVYSQPYEGGGALMYQLNRSVFTIIYVSIAIFSVLLSLKKLKYAGPSYFVIMSLLTLYLDFKVKKTFVKPSMTLSLTNARSIDEELQLRVNIEKKYEEKYQEYQSAKKLAREISTGNVSEDTSVRPYSTSTSTHSEHSKVKSRGKSKRKNAAAREQKHDFYLYRQPQLNTTLWETAPRPYHMY